MTAPTNGSNNWLDTQSLLVLAAPVKQEQDLHIAVK